MKDPGYLVGAFRVQGLGLSSPYLGSPYDQYLGVYIGALVFLERPSLQVGL